MNIFGGNDQGSSEQPQSSQSVYYPNWYSQGQENIARRGLESSYQPYQPYPGAELAGFTQDQTNSMSRILNARPSPYYAQGASAVNSGIGAMQKSIPMFQSTVNRYNAFSPERVHANYKPIALPAASQYMSEDFKDADMAGFMSPYMQNVVDVEKRKATEDAQQMAQRNAYNANQASSFGGSRHGVIDARHKLDTQRNLSEIQAFGQEKAWADASQKFEQQRQQFYKDEALREQSQQFRTTAGINQNQFGSNQIYNADTFNANLGAQTAYNKANVGIAGARGVADVGRGMVSAGGVLGGLGSAYDSANQNYMGMSMGVGQMQQDLLQRSYDLQKANWTESRDWEKNQLDWYNQLLAGFRPEMYSEKSTYESNPSAYQTYQGYRAQPTTDNPTPSPWGYAKGGIVGAKPTTAVGGLPGLLAQHFSED